MLNRFWAWVASSAWPALRDTILEGGAWVLDKFFSVSKLYWLLACTLFSLVLTLAMATAWAVREIADMMSTVDFQAIKAGSAGMLQYGAFINRFIPLSEGLAGAIVCFDIWLVVVTIRWIKSFIPTVSN